MLIAWDRMRWLGDPMTARLPAFVCSCATWLTGMVIALPYPIYTTYLDLGVSALRSHSFMSMLKIDEAIANFSSLFLILFRKFSTVLRHIDVSTAISWSRNLHCKSRRRHAGIYAWAIFPNVCLFPLLLANSFG